MDKANVKTVVLIDDYPLFRKAMADVLNATDRFTVLAQTGDQTVARGLAVLQPDLGWRFLWSVLTRSASSRKSAHTIRKVVLS